MFESIRRFLRLEASSGLVLMGATLIALLVANSPWQSDYHKLLSLTLTVSIEQYHIAKPIQLWINDGLMAIFFLLVGLELKREIIEGELNSTKKMMLPMLAAFGGMVAPALIYAFFNITSEPAIKGWAIPTATDIAFTLGILILLGDRIPRSLKIFLVSLAIFDDLGAIIIIAIFYTDQLSLNALFISMGCIVCLWLMNRVQVVSKAAYLLVGVFMWLALLKSGVHATLAGVVLAIFVPVRGIDWDQKKCQPLQELENDLHGPVGFFIVPVFAFANAGLSLSKLNLSDVFEPISMGIILGLVLGKQLGVMIMVWLGIRFKLGVMPNNVTMSHGHKCMALPFCVASALP
jgi:NhaA family Na+:H+ antiporter